MIEILFKWNIEKRYSAEKMLFIISMALSVFIIDFIVNRLVNSRLSSEVKKKELKKNSVHVAYLLKYVQYI